MLQYNKIQSNNKISLALLNPNCVFPHIEIRKLKFLMLRV